MLVSVYRYNPETDLSPRMQEGRLAHAVQALLEFSQRLYRRAYGLR